MDVQSKIDQLLVNIRNEGKPSSLGLKPPKQDALARAQQLQTQNPAYTSAAIRRLVGKLETGDIPQDVPHFTDAKAYKKAVDDFLANGGTTREIKKKVGILVGTGHNGKPAYQVYQSIGSLMLRSANEAANTQLNRELNTVLSNPDATSRAQADARMREVTRPGIAADHDHSLTRVGNAMDPMTEQRRTEYRNNFKNSGQRAGHYPENIKPLSAADNRLKENGALKIDPDGKKSGGYVRLDNNILKPAEARKPSPTIQQLQTTGTTTSTGRQGAARVARSLPGFPKFRGNLGMNGSLLMMVPDLIDAADSQTGGAVSRTLDGAVNGAVDALRTRIGKGVNGLTSLLIPNKLSNVSYGQY